MSSTTSTTTSDQHNTTQHFGNLFSVVSIFPKYVLYSLLAKSTRTGVFNWTCVTCSVLDQSPLHLEMQFIVEHGPYTDLDGEKWIKCSKCSSPYHVKYLSTENSVGEYICTFMACNNWFPFNFHCQYVSLLFFYYISVNFCLVYHGP